MSSEQAVILCVDDEPNVLKSLQRTLRKLDVEVLTATSGSDGLRLLDNRQVDVIVSDMRMPEMAGPEFLKQAALKQPHTRRIVLSGQADAEAVQSAVNEGGVSLYLNKPWNDDRLRRAITDAVRFVRLERENEHLSELTLAQNEELKTLNADLEARVLRRTEELEHTAGVLENTLQELETAYEQMVDLIANIAAMPDPESENMRLKTHLALLIGEALDLDDENLTHLRHAARLHRLGWIGVSPQVTRMAQAEMNDEQRTTFEKHPSYAEAVLLSVSRLKQAGEIVGAQHEMFNGEGYPNRSVGDGIPLEARILAVARDYFDLQSGRIQAKKTTPAGALAYIVEHGGSAYDPDVVATFRKVVTSLDNMDVTLDEIAVKTISLLPGMRLARDLTTDEGVVLLAKGSSLTEGTIGTLLTLERRSDRELEVFIRREEHDEQEVKS